MDGYPCGDCYQLDPHQALRSSHLILGYFAVLDYPSADTHFFTAKQNLSRVMEAKAPAEQLRL